jgi:hypothetical protein
MSIILAAYNDTVLMMWFVSFVLLEIGGAVGWAAFKSVIGFILFQIIIFLILVVFFPDLFGLIK